MPTMMPNTAATAPAIISEITKSIGAGMDTLYRASIEVNIAAL